MLSLSIATSHTSPSLPAPSGAETGMHEEEQTKIRLSFNTAGVCFRDGRCLAAHMSWVVTFGWQVSEARHCSSYRVRSFHIWHLKGNVVYT